MGTWKTAEKILCIRADNMGDVLMSSPAIRVLKDFTRAEITMLTSTRGREVAYLIPEIDRVMVCDLPWVKVSADPAPGTVSQLVKHIKTQQFDACVVFTVYSQNPLPAAMIAYLAGIPLRLAYCRENPYGLLTDWFPDPEPLTTIHHQVERDVNLVARIGARGPAGTLSLAVPDSGYQACRETLERIGINPDCRLIVLHTGVSEIKRRFPESIWADVGRQLILRYKVNVLLTGLQEEASGTASLQALIGKGSWSLAGMLSLPALTALIQQATALVAVNTGTVHIAAALHTPVVVLYARTNPQHGPWRVPHRMLEFDFSEHLKSKNEIIRYVDRTHYAHPVKTPGWEQIIQALDSLLSEARSSPERHA